MAADAQAGSAGRRKLRLALAAVILGLAIWFGGKAFGWWGAQVREGALKLYGNVEIREVELGFRIGGRIEQLLVDEGDLVTPGQLLARLEQRPMQDRLASADARLEAATASAARDARGNRPQEIAAAEAAVRDAEAALGESQRLHERRKALLDKGFISKADYQTSEAGVTAASARLDSARAALSLAREGARSEDKAVTRAGAAAAFADKRAVETDLADTQLVASEAGQVLTRAREAGTIVQPGETVLTVALTQPVRVRAYIAEPDLPKIRPAMRVTISVDGSDKRWPATIGFVSPTAEFTPKTVQTEQLRSDLVYRLRLIVEDPKGELRQGQPVTVHVSGQR
jgi:HlyD family secretion protein